MKEHKSNLSYQCQKYKRILKDYMYMFIDWMSPFVSSLRILINLLISDFIYYWFPKYHEDIYLKWINKDRSVHLYNPTPPLSKDVMIVICHPSSPPSPMSQLSQSPPSSSSSSLHSSSRDRSRSIDTTLPRDAKHDLTSNKKASNRYPLPTTSSAPLPSFLHKHRTGNEFLSTPSLSHYNLNRLIHHISDKINIYNLQTPDTSTAPTSLLTSTEDSKKECYSNVVERKIARKIDESSTKSNNITQKNNYINEHPTFSTNRDDNGRVSRINLNVVELTGPCPESFESNACNPNGACTDNEHACIKESTPLTKDGNSRYDSTCIFGDACTLGDVCGAGVSCLSKDIHITHQKVHIKGVDSAEKLYICLHGVPDPSEYSNNNNTNNINLNNYGREPEDEILINELRLLMMKSKMLVFLHPVYWFDVPSNLKAFIDRIFIVGQSFRPLPSHSLLTLISNIIFPFVYIFPPLRHLLNAYSSVGLLRDKYIYIIQTLGGPAIGPQLFGHSSSSLESTLRFCGASISQVSRIGTVGDISQYNHINNNSNKIINSNTPSHPQSIIVTQHTVPVQTVPIENVPIDSDITISSSQISQPLTNSIPPSLALDLSSSSSASTLSSRSVIQTDDSLLSIHQSQLSQFSQISQSPKDPSRLPHPSSLSQSPPLDIPKPFSSHSDPSASSSFSSTDQASLTRDPAASHYQEAALSSTECQSQLGSRCPTEDPSNSSQSFTVTHRGQSKSSSDHTSTQSTQTSLKGPSTLNGLASSPDTSSPLLTIGNSRLANWDRKLEGVAEKMLKTMFK